MKEAETEGMEAWAEERRRLGADVAGAVAQAMFRQRSVGPKGPSDRSWGGMPQPDSCMLACMVRDGEVAESQGRAARLQLQEATAAIVRLQGVVERQQGRIDALEAGGEARTGERREARVPQCNLRAHGTGSRSLAGEFEAAAAVSPQNDAEPGDLEAQVEQLWREVAAAQAIHGAAEAAAVVEAESKAEVGAGASTGGFTAIAATTEAEVDACRRGPRTFGWRLRTAGQRNGWQPPLWRRTTIRRRREARRKGRQRRLRRTPWKTRTFPTGRTLLQLRTRAR